MVYKLVVPSKHSFGVFIDESRYPIFSSPYEVPFTVLAAFSKSKCLFKFLGEVVTHELVYCAPGILIIQTPPVFPLNNFIECLVIVLVVGNQPSKVFFKTVILMFMTLMPFVIAMFVLEVLSEAVYSLLYAMVTIVRYSKSLFEFSVD